MLELAEQLHQICSFNNTQIVPQKSFSILLTVKVLGHYIGKNTDRPITSNVDGIHRLSTHTSKTELMLFIGSMNFYSNFINKINVSPKLFYPLFHDDISFEWIPELEKLSNEI